MTTEKKFKIYQVVSAVVTIILLIAMVRCAQLDNHYREMYYELSFKYPNTASEYSKQADFYFRMGNILRFVMVGEFVAYAFVIVKNIKQKK